MRVKEEAEAGSNLAAVPDSSGWLIVRADIPEGTPNHVDFYEHRSYIRARNIALVGWVRLGSPAWT
jgi:hypothetical protein